MILNKKIRKKRAQIFSPSTSGSVWLWHPPLKGSDGRTLWMTPYLNEGLDTSETSYGFRRNPENPWESPQILAESPRILGDPLESPGILQNPENPENLSPYISGNLVRNFRRVELLVCLSPWGYIIWIIALTCKKNPGEGPEEKKNPPTPIFSRSQTHIYRFFPGLRPISTDFRRKLSGFLTIVWRLLACS